MKRYEEILIHNKNLSIQVAYNNSYEIILYEDGEATSSIAGIKANSLDELKIELKDNCNDERYNDLIDSLMIEV